MLFQTGRTGEKTYLRATLVTLENNVKGWRIELDKPLGSNQAVNVEVDVLLGNALEMYPAEIEQKEKETTGLTDGQKFFKFIIAGMAMHSGIVAFLP